MPHTYAYQPRNVIEQGIRRVRTKDFIAGFGEQLETVPIRDARARRDDDLIRRNIQSVIILSDCFARRPLPQRIGPVDARCFGRVLQYFVKLIRGIQDAMLVYVAPNEIDDVGALGLQSIVQQVERILRPTEICREIREEHFHVPSLAVLESRVMLEVRFQTYWSDADPAGIVFFPHFFRFVEQAEEEMFHAAGEIRQTLLETYQVWLPRVEAFSRFSRPIRCGAAIRVRLNPEIKGDKTIRYDFEIVDDQSSDPLAAGYITVVCVDAERFKATAIPPAIRSVILN